MCALFPNFLETLQVAENILLITHLMPHSSKYPEHLCSCKIFNSGCSIEPNYFPDRGNDNWLIKYDRTPVVADKNNESKNDEVNNIVLL